MTTAMWYPSTAARLLATASSDRTVRLWEPASAGCTLVIPVHHAALSLAWIDDRLAIGLSAGILVIDLNADLFMTELRAALG